MQSIVKGFPLHDIIYISFFLLSCRETIREAAAEDRGRNREKDESRKKQLPFLLRSFSTLWPVKEALLSAMKESDEVESIIKLHSHYNTEKGIIKALSAALAKIKAKHWPRVTAV